APIEEERKRPAQGRGPQEVCRQEANRNPGGGGPRSRPVNRQRTKIRSGYIKALLRQPDGVGAGPASQVDGLARLDALLPNDAPQLARRLSRIPWNFARSIVFVPLCDVSHLLPSPWSCCTSSR